MCLRVVILFIVLYLKKTRQVCGGRSRIYPALPHRIPSLASHISLSWPSLLSSLLFCPQILRPPHQTKPNPPPPPPFPPAAATSRWPEAAAQAQARRRAGRVPAAAGAVGRAIGTAAAAATATTPSARSATAASSRASSSTPTPRATPSGCPAPGTGSAPVTPLSQRPAYFFFFCLLCFCPGLRCGFRFRVSQLPPLFYIHLECQVKK